MNGAALDGGIEYNFDLSGTPITTATALSISVTSFANLPR